MALLPLSEIQTAIYQTLTPALAPVPVLDYAGPDQEYPYVTLGEFSALPADLLREEAVDADLTIHFWSRQRGMEEIELMMAAAKDALHAQVLPAAGFQWVQTLWQFGQTLRDPDGVTRHGVMRFRVMTFEATTT